jgi:hypothetical protein
MPDKMLHRTAFPLHYRDAGELFVTLSFDPKSSVQMNLHY